MLVSSSDRLQMIHLNDVMTRAGLKCSLRDQPQTPEEAPFAFYPELWLHEDDYRTGVVILTSYKPKSAASSVIGL
jgi:hypothetical protein